MKGRLFFSSRCLRLYINSRNAELVPIGDLNSTKTELTSQITRLEYEGRVLCREAAEMSVVIEGRTRAQNAGKKARRAWTPR